MDKDILKQVELEDLSEGVLDLVYVLGIDTFLEVINHCGGGYIYLPSKSSIVRNTRNRLIKKDFIKGLTHIQIANKYNISDTQVRNILKAKNRIY
ncbi:MAG: Mor transcription activator family protein [Paraclostridium sp.]